MTKKSYPSVLSLMAAASICLLSSIPLGNALAAPLKNTSLESIYGNTFFMASSEKDDKGVWGPARGWHFYWEDGYLTIEDRRANIYFMINGQVIADAGYIDADDELENAFPGLTGSSALFRISEESSSS